jgi:hypothetical protein
MIPSPPGRQGKSCATECTAIKPMRPNKPRGVPRVNDRRVLNGIAVAHLGCKKRRYRVEIGAIGASNAGFRYTGATKG